jgi:hypothetical protein
LLQAITDCLKRLKFQEKGKAEYYEVPNLVHGEGLDLSDDLQKLMKISFLREAKQRQESSPRFRTLAGFTQSIAP